VLRDAEEMSMKKNLPFVIVVLRAVGCRRAYQRPAS
jgi:hypothetical protein